MPRKTSQKYASRIKNARPDTIDFRDRMYVPTLVEVPQRIDLDVYLKRLSKVGGVKILDQGKEGACTGFALASVVHYLLQTRQVDSDPGAVSPQMLYAMARRYDEWPGEDYDGSSARGAMKGWHKHGVCDQTLWKKTGKNALQSLTDGRAVDALRRPLGAYFRVDHKDLVAMHAAIAEVGILYATASVHAGWDAPSRTTGLIAHDPSVDGGHAFSIVGYDHRGFWIQNSWGKGWGKGGFGLVTYEDWLENGADAWVARLGVPIELPTAVDESRAGHAALARQVGAYSHRDLRPHIISIGNDGKLRDSGPFATTERDVHTIFTDDIPTRTASWKKKRILLYAHGGLVSEKSAIERVADYRQALLDNEVYPLAFVWKTDFWTTLKNILKDAIRGRRSEGILDASKDFLLDRLDDTLEPVARLATGKAQWDEMKENALLSTISPDGGARTVLRELATLAGNDPAVEIHVVGHSAGSIFHAPIVWSLTAPAGTEPGRRHPLHGCTGLGLGIESCTLWAPACTRDLFVDAYGPGIESDAINRFALFTLTDRAEQDDHCAHVYHKSLLYLVSNAFESRPRIPLFRDGEPILGMEKFIKGKTKKLLQRPNCDHVLAPNDASGPDGSQARDHGGFDDDRATVLATLSRITGRKRPRGQVSFARSASSRGDRRRALG